MAFRDRVNAAEAAELARIRKKLKLTQMEAAQLAGGNKNAFSRYERGQAKPVAAVVNLFLSPQHSVLPLNICRIAPSTNKVFVTR